MTSDLTLAHATAQRVLDCMCAAVAEASEYMDGAHPGCPCRTFVAPGEVVYSCPPVCAHRDPAHASGQLTVSVARIGTFTTFPLLAPVDLSCNTTRLGAELVVTLLRCAPSSNTAGPASGEALQAAAEVLHTDMMAMQRAAACCVPHPFGQRRKAMTAIISHEVTGPEGGCVGSVMRLAVAMGSLCACETEPPS